MRAESNNVSEYQAVVIGSGPAGSTAAHSLARGGVRTLLVDRGEHPRHKVCGCCLAPSGETALRNAGLERALAGAQPLSHLTLHWRGRKAVVRTPGYASIGRHMLDAALAQAAQDAGADTAWRSSARVECDGSVLVRSHNGAERTIRGAVVICADGLQGNSLARHPAFKWRVARGSRIGVGATLSADACDIAADEVRMMIFESGYVGVVRLPGGEVDVAAAVAPTALRAASSPRALLLDALLQAGCSAAAIDQAAWAGTPTLTRSRWPIAAERVLVAGDAAAYVEPITGEGMSWAIATGLAAGEHAREMIATGADARGWNARFSKITRSARWRCSAISTLLRAPMLVSGALQFVRRAPRTAAALAQPIRTGVRA